ncbi:hypothetical protein SUGI_1119570 [Cryptomeria japonica]|nr:hypothetical protein SUGI_1119570 [Cryptomeria japonica]
MTPNLIGECPNFNPWKHQINEQQTWIRLYNLPTEYWARETLEELGNNLGSFVIVEIKEDGFLGSYAQISINIKASGNILKEIEIQIDGQIWLQGLECEDNFSISSLLEDPRNSLDNNNVVVDCRTQKNEILHSGDMKVIPKCEVEIPDQHMTIIIESIPLEDDKKEIHNNALEVNLTLNMIEETLDLNIAINSMARPVEEEKKENDLKYEDDMNNDTDMEDSYVDD